jgi:alpha-L-rhamnosidase
VQPQPGGGLTSARAELMTQYGSASSGWKLDADRMSVTVRVPPNTRATVRLPNAKLPNVTEGGRAVGASTGVTAARQNVDAVVVEIGSGEYAFEYPYAPTPAPRPVTGASGGR